MRRSQISLQIGWNNQEGVANVLSEGPLAMDGLQPGGNPEIFIEDGVPCPRCENTENYVRIIPHGEETPFQHSMRHAQEGLLRLETYGRDDPNKPEYDEHQVFWPEGPYDLEDREYDADCAREAAFGADPPSSVGFEGNLMDHVRGPTEEGVVGPPPYLGSTPVRGIALTAPIYVG